VLLVNDGYGRIMAGKQKPQRLGGRSWLYGSSIVNVVSGVWWLLLLLEMLFICCARCQKYAGQGLSE